MNKVSNGVIPPSTKKWFYIFIEPLIIKIAALIHPNVLTLFSIVPCLITTRLIAKGKFGLASIFLLLTGFFDAIDGSVAKRSGKQSKIGALLDSTVDRFNEAMLFAGIGYYFIFFKPTHPRLLIGIVIYGALVASFLISYVRARSEGLGIDCKVGGLQRTERFLILFIALVLNALCYSLFATNIVLLLGISVIFVFGWITVIQRIIHCYLQEKNQGPS